MSKALKVADGKAVHETEPQFAAIDPFMAMIEKASRDPAVDLDKMQRLFEMFASMQERKARIAFEKAMADAKGQIPPIVKNRVVDFTSAKGRTSYRHEDLAEIARVVDPILGAHGLSYRYRSKQDGGKVTVTCIMSHIDGHADETTLTAGEDHTGNKNSSQSIGSAATFLQRYTLKLALGLATTGDDDGKAAGGEANAITEDQELKLRDMMEATGADVAAFCKYFKVAKLAALPAKDFSRAMQALEKKAAQQ